MHHLQSIDVAQYYTLYMQLLFLQSFLPAFTLDARDASGCLPRVEFPVAEFAPDEWRFV